MDEGTIIKEALLISAEIFSAGAVVLGAVFALCRWVIRQNKQDTEIKALKEEQTVICYGVLAATLTVTAGLWWRAKPLAHWVAYLNPPKTMYK